MPDGWTVVTKDHSLSAQWEHMVLVTPTGHEVLTLERRGAARSRRGMIADPAALDELRFPRRRDIDWPLLERLPALLAAGSTRPTAAASC